MDNILISCEKWDEINGIKNIIWYRIEKEVKWKFNILLIWTFPIYRNKVMENQEFLNIFLVFAFNTLSVEISN